jgi:hypothetical protein
VQTYRPPRRVLSLMMFARARSFSRLARPLAGATGAATGIMALSQYQPPASRCLKIDLDDETAKGFLAALSKSSLPAATAMRQGALLPSPSNPKIKCCVVECGPPAMDSISIANSVIKAGGSCDIQTYRDLKHAEFTKAIDGYDALIVRMEPGQLSKGTLPGTQARFEALVESFIRKGGIVWSSPGVSQTRMGAADALYVLTNTLGTGGSGELASLLSSSA